MSTPACPLTTRCSLTSVSGVSIAGGDAPRCTAGTLLLMHGLGCAELQVKFLRGLSDVRARQGETVVLWCELCKARGDVVWLKDGRPLAPDTRREVRVQGRERSLVLSRVGPEDAGEYCCESNDDRTLATLTVQGEHQPPARGPPKLLHPPRAGGHPP